MPVGLKPSFLAEEKLIVNEDLSRSRVFTLELDPVRVIIRLTAFSIVMNPDEAMGNTYDPRKLELAR